MHTLMSRVLLARQTDYTSMLPAACQEGCATFGRIYPQCRADPIGEPCMAVCQVSVLGDFMVGMSVESR